MVNGLLQKLAGLLLLYFRKSVFALHDETNVVSTYLNWKELVINQIQRYLSAEHVSKLPSLVSNQLPKMTIKHCFR